MSYPLNQLKAIIENETKFLERQMLARDTQLDDYQIAQFELELRAVTHRILEDGEGLPST